MSVVASGFPQVHSPFVDDTGHISQAWLQLLITMWNRTGGAGGDVTADSDLHFPPYPSSDLQAQIDALAQLILTVSSSSSANIVIEAQSDLPNDLMLMGG